jgi:hypothetical protein
MDTSRWLELAGVKAVKTPIMESQYMNEDDKVKLIIEMKMENFDYSEINHGKGPEFVAKTIKDFVAADQSILTIVVESTERPLAILMKNKNNYGWVMNNREVQYNCGANETTQLVESIMSSYGASNYAIKLLK